MTTAVKMRLRRSVLSPGPEREQWYRDHPFVADTLRLSTVPLEEAFGVVMQVIVHCDPGLCIYGNPRAGKSKAAQIIKTLIERTLPDMPVVLIVATSIGKSPESLYFSDLFAGFGYLYPEGRPSAVVLNDKAINILKSMAEQRKSKRITLLIDEAQNWSLPIYTFLRDLTNKLEILGVRITTVLFGHTELLKLRDAAVSKGRTDLVGRFFFSVYRFRGIANEKELLTLFQSFDNSEAAEFPDGSEISYSEFMLPAEWKSGWRLVGEIEEAWGAIVKVAGEGSRPATDIEMKWIVNSIKNYILAKKANEGKAELPSSMNLWLDAVRNSGLLLSGPLHVPATV